jgi:hypothetical protein
VKARYQKEQQRVRKISKAVDAAQGRRGRDSMAAEAQGPKERQEQVSTPLHRKGYRLGHWFGQDQ